jgi:hypothetical protein
MEKEPRPKRNHGFKNCIDAHENAGSHDWSIKNVQFSYLNLLEQRREEKMPRSLVMAWLLVGCR